MKIKTYIKGNRFKLWRIIEQGDIKPVDVMGFPNVRDEFTDTNIENLELNSKDVLIFQGVLS